MANFDPTQTPPPAASDVVLDCAAQFDSSANARTLDQWCGATAPAVWEVMLSNGESAVVLAMTGFTISATGSLHLSGDVPVILAVYGDAQLYGPLDANADQAGPDAGSNATDCGNGGPGEDRAGGGSGGGGGGGFGEDGATGGDGDSGDGSGGTLGAAPGGNLEPLRGGCAGGPGGPGDSGTTRVAVGGAGGGALQLSVAGTCTLGSLVAANGGGGAAVDSDHSGGGGGGSGGGVLVQAATLLLTGSAAVVANGGGGGGGNDDPGAGEPGFNGLFQDVAAPGGASGGGASAGGGNGGHASGAATSPTQASANNSGGGGGGGGVGVIRLDGLLPGGCTSSGATLSPLPVVCP